MDRDAILAALTRYIVDEILEGEGDDLTPDSPLLELGVLNSLEIARMLRFVRRELSVDVPHEALYPANLESLTAIAEMVHGLSAGRPA